MAQWEKKKVQPSEINSGSEFTRDSVLTLKELNAIVDNSFYASDMVESLINQPLDALADRVGTAHVYTQEYYDENGQLKRRFVFENLKGERGEQGVPNTLSIGTVEEGVVARATITGESPNQKLNLMLPKGETGATGARGEQGLAGRGIFITSATLNTGITQKTYIDKSSLYDAQYGEREFVNNSIIVDTAGTVAIGLYLSETEIICETMFSVKGEQGEQGEQGVAGVNGTNGRSVYLTSSRLNPESFGQSGFLSTMISNPVPFNEFTTGSILIDRYGGMAEASSVQNEPNSDLYTIFYRYLTSLKGEQGKVGATFTYDENTKTLTINTEV